MHPVLKRILINGGLTAAVLGGVGLLFAQLAAGWASSNVKPSPGEEAASVPESIRVNVPLMMAFWGFVFVAAAELVLWRLRGHKPPAPPAEKQPDETEKLLNELLERAEAARAAEAAGGRSQESADSAQEPGTGQKREEQKAG
jgi:hypothetical protein